MYFSFIHSLNKESLISFSINPHNDKPNYSLSNRRTLIKYTATIAAAITIAGCNTLSGEAVLAGIPAFDPITREDGVGVVDSIFKEQLNITFTHDTLVSLVDSSLGTINLEADGYSTSEKLIYELVSLSNDTSELKILSDNDWHILDSENNFAEHKIFQLHSTDKDGIIYEVMDFIEQNMKEE